MSAPTNPTDPSPSHKQINKGKRSLKRSLQNVSTPFERKEQWAKLGDSHVRFELDIEGARWQRMDLLVRKTARRYGLDCVIRQERGLIRKHFDFRISGPFDQLVDFAEDLHGALRQYLQDQSNSRGGRNL